jgi:Rha family phage regulatory protein
MYDLSIIKQNGGVYVDSRDVAEVIGKSHKHLLRDIRGYVEILRKIGRPNFGLSDFFVESSFLNVQNKIMPRYLISKMGCELVANKLTGEKGVLFTAAYVTKFNEMEAAERDAESKAKAQAKPRLDEFNSAVKNILNGMSYSYTTPHDVMKFLRGVYEPLGIEVKTEGDYYSYFTATEIAELVGVYSSTGRPHGHAVSAIISKFRNYAHHMIVIPYGLVGVAFHYDSKILSAVRDWLVHNNYPHEIPYHNFNYHIYYDRNISLSGFDEEVFFKYD